MPTSRSATLPKTTHLTEAIKRRNALVADADGHSWDDSNEAGGLSPSQSSSFSISPEDDISGLIAQYSTQPTEPKAGGSAASSFDQVPLTQTSTGSSTVTDGTVKPASKSFTLGKRKQEDHNSTPVPPSRPFKQARSESNLLFKAESNLVPPVDAKSGADVTQSKAAEAATEPVILSWRKTMGFFNRIPFGARWEIGRWVIASGRVSFTSLTPEHFNKLESFPTNVAAVPQAAKLMKSMIKGLEDELGEDESDPFSARYAKEDAALSPWEELDKEEDRLRSGNPLANLGFDENGQWTGEYGGKVEFRGSLHHDPFTGFRVRLERPTLGPSTQLARRFGSKNLFRLKIMKGSQGHKDLLQFLARPFVICGGVYRAFYAKEQNVFFVKTNEDMDKLMFIPDPLIKDVPSFFDFLDFHNPMDATTNQKMAKWASRFALGLSNSVPGLLLKPENIRFKDDIEHPETGSVMTDGAGSMSRMVATQLHRNLGWDYRPTAIQVRVFGSKGLLVDDTDGDHEQEPIVWLTPSQRKIFYRLENCDPVHRVIDVLRASQTKTQCRLSVETIINLAENKVPKEVFIGLLSECISAIVTPLLQWDSDDSAHTLWYLVQKLGGVLSAKRARESAGTARVQGYSERDLDENEWDDEDGFTQLDLAEQKAPAWWADPISGCPSSLEETVLEFLDSGFMPQSCHVQREKLKHIIRRFIKNISKTYRMTALMSCSAWIIPDTRGVLEEGEIYFKSSSRNLLRPNGTLTDELIGDVLVTRNPSKLPTDVQKWRAVHRPELRDLVDVVVLSTKGARRAADWLAGGDYDGDKVTVIWDPKIVDPFKTADPSHGDPPDDAFKEANFEADTTNISVADFLAQNAKAPPVERVRKIQKYLLDAVTDTSAVGKYSNFHDNAVYKYGFAHPKAIRLAHMFCLTLDGSKTGMKVKKDVLDRDSREFNHRAPAWKETEEEKDKMMHNSNSNQLNLKRPKNLPTFIMDHLYQASASNRDEWLVKVDAHYAKFGHKLAFDETLLQPFYDVLKKCDEKKPATYDFAGALAVWKTIVKPGEPYEEEKEGYRRDIKLVYHHIQEIWEDHRLALCQGSGDSGSSPHKRGSPQKISPRKGAGFTELPIERRQDIIRALSKRFAAKPDPAKMHTVESHLSAFKASYAYFFYCFKSHEKGRSYGAQFPFDVAFRALCAIKVGASNGNGKAIQDQFYDRFYMKAPKILNPQLEIARAYL
ncbi:RNA-directed RNA polymerase [Coprinopsis cinerea okayama7|uniref:RNA-dependent RNA polymerase n=1 Tax=Coprinopsis cinerea (strain Okayama-7 / 130 / ATCC MYA-4618 / FGSC 9003) TaxID=240176 RepID=A8NXL9_COPC7|nr:RNA-directed RNA polymerase [Coprinopsis cinerea okayama7\|eukprot:XP_001837206.2 RNA-directed RNA polymerase [Coprinopsis cinerea okayama7\